MIVALTTGTYIKPNTPQAVNAKGLVSVIVDLNYCTYFTILYRHNLPSKQIFPS